MTAQILVVDDQPDMKALVLQKFRHQFGTEQSISCLPATALKLWPC